MTSTQRTLTAQIAAHVRWARTPDRTAATAPARAAFDARFEREVDPERVLPSAERAASRTPARPTSRASPSARRSGAVEASPDLTARRRTSRNSATSA